MLKQFLAENKKVFAVFVIFLAVFAFFGLRNFFVAPAAEDAKQLFLTKKEEEKVIPGKEDNQEITRPKPAVGEGAVLKNPDNIVNPSIRAASPSLAGPDITNPIAEQKKISVRLEAGEKKYAASVSEGSSVYQLMTKLSEQADFSFLGRKVSGLGYFVEEINGVKNSPRENKFWTYLVNGQFANVGVSYFILKDGDLVLWQYK